jgi:hypothetical protein
MVGSNEYREPEPQGPLYTYSLTPRPCIRHSGRIQLYLGKAGLCSTTIDCPPLVLISSIRLTVLLPPRNKS